MSMIRRSVAMLLIVAALVTGIFVGRATADQPYMQAALSQLQQAQDSLWAASANKGGHRERALNLVQAAINEVQEGINFAR